MNIDVKTFARRIFGTLGGETDTEPIPDECPNCNLPVGVTALKTNDEPVAQSWFCIYCGNSPSSEPDRSRTAAHDTLRERLEFLDGLMREVESGER